MPARSESTESSLFGAILGALPPKLRLLILGAAAAAAAGTLLDYRIEAHMQPIRGDIAMVGADVKDLATSIKASQAATDRRLDGQDVTIAGIQATIKADERQPFAGHAP